MYVEVWLGLLLAPAAAKDGAPEIRVGKDVTRVEVTVRLGKEDVAALPQGKLDARTGERRLQLALVDAETGKLYFKETVILDYTKKRGPKQEAVLVEFENAAWTETIVCPKESDAETIVNNLKIIPGKFFTDR